MGQLLLFIVVALVVAAIVFGVTVMMGGGDSGLTPVEPDGTAVPLPSDRPLGEDDVVRTRFDTAWRGYRMAQVDQALQRAAYDIGYKGELISVLEAEVAALRDGRMAEADALRRAREAAIAPPDVPTTRLESPPATSPTTPPTTPPTAPSGPPPATPPGPPPAGTASGPVIELSAVPPEERPGDSDAKESAPVERR
jgi:DivIVA domain-containing protein